MRYQAEIWRSRIGWTAYNFESVPDDGREYAMQCPYLIIWRPTRKGINRAATRVLRKLEREDAVPASAYTIRA